MILFVVAALINVVSALLLRRIIKWYKQARVELLAAVDRAQHAASLLDKAQVYATEIRSQADRD